MGYAPVAAKVLVWRRGRLVTLQILASSSCPWWRRLTGSLGQCVSFSLIDAGRFLLPAWFLFFPSVLLCAWQDTLVQARACIHTHTYPHTHTKVQMHCAHGHLMARLLQGTSLGASQGTSLGASQGTSLGASQGTSPGACIKLHPSEPIPIYAPLPPVSALTRAARTQQTHQRCPQRRGSSTVHIATASALPSQQTHWHRPHSQRAGC